MKSLVMFVFTFVLFVFIHNGSAYAQEYLIVDLDSSENSIKLEWEDTSNEYAIYLLESDGKAEELWKGSQTKFTHDELETNTPYSYKVVSYDSLGEIDDYVIVNTSTMDKENKIESFRNDIKIQSNSENSKLYYSMEDSKLDIMYNSEMAFISWENIPTDDNEYEIYKDGELLSTVNGTEYIDNNITKDEVYHYTIIGNKEIPESAKSKKLQKIDKEISDLTEDEKKGLFYEPKQASVIVRTNENSVWYGSRNNSEQLTSSNAQSNNLSQYPDGVGFLMRYTTFIPMAYADAPSVCNLPITGLLCPSDVDYYHGDGRGFDAWSDDFRTRSDVYVTWDALGNPYDVIQQPYTGITYGYDSNYNIVAEDQADAEADHNVWNIEYGDNWIYHRASVASSNPLITLAPNIDGFYYAQIWEDGRGDLYGVHDRAPSHELYMMDYPGSFYFDLLQFEHIDFHQLMPYTQKNEWLLEFY